MEKNRLEALLSSRIPGLLVKFLPDGSMELSDYRDGLLLVSLYQETEDFEKALIVNLKPIASRVREKMSESIGENGYLSKEAGSFSGVPQRTVQLWTEKGFIVPGVKGTTGTGQRRLYSDLNCIEIAIIQSLAKERLSFKLIGQVMEYLRQVP